jgi:hypothetical protein
MVKIGILKTNKMKKILILLAFIAFAVCLQAQTTVRMSSETVGFWTLCTDTMLVKKSDRAVKMSVFVPEYSTDSAKVTGCTFIIDGIPANGIIIPPDYGYTIGDHYAPLDSVKIESWDKTWIMMLIDRD